MNVGNFYQRRLVVRLHQRDLLTGLDRTRVNAADRDPAHIVGPIEIRHQHLQRRVGINLGAGDRFEHQVEQRLHRVAGHIRVIRRVPAFARGENMREVVEHVLAAEIHEQLETFVERFVRSSIGAIDLVDDDNRLQLALERLGEHVPGLRHRPFGRVDKHQRAVGHPQHALDLAAEVGVARRVDEIDFHAVVVEGDVLGQDRDAALALQVVRVENAIADELAGTELAALAQQAIDERRLAVIDVGDDGDVTNVGTAHFGRPGRRAGGYSRHQVGLSGGVWRAVAKWVKTRNSTTNSVRRVRRIYSGSCTETESDSRRRATRRALDLGGTGAGQQPGTNAPRKGDLRWRCGGVGRPASNE